MEKRVAREFLEPPDPQASLDPEDNLVLMAALDPSDLKE